MVQSVWEVQKSGRFGRSNDSGRFKKSGRFGRSNGSESFIRYGMFVNSGWSMRFRRLVRSGRFCYLCPTRKPLLQMMNDGLDSYFYFLIFVN